MHLTRCQEKRHCFITLEAIVCSIYRFALQFCQAASESKANILENKVILTFSTSVIPASQSILSQPIRSTHLNHLSLAHQLLSSLSIRRGRKNGDPQPHPPTWLGLTTAVDFPCGRIQHESSTRADEEGSQTSSGLSAYLEVPTSGHGKATAEFSESERSVDLKYTWKVKPCVQNLSTAATSFHIITGTG